MAETRKCSTSLMQFLLRRALTVTVAGVCLVGLGALTVPAAVAAINQATLDANAQSFHVAPLTAVAAKAGVASAEVAAAVEPPVRDDFTVQLFSLVQWPVAQGSGITYGFGPRSCAGCSSMHLGLDFTPGAGYPVEAVADGVVITAEYDGSYGNHVLIQHSIDGVTFITHYAHMQGLNVSVGQTVPRGTVLGAVGNTGSSYGAHLHFEVHNSAGTPINPMPWLSQYANIGYGE